VTALDDITATDPAASGEPSDVLRDELRDDIANAERYAAEHADRLRYVAGFVPPWRVWDGTRWAADETGEHMEAAKRTADRLFTEAVARDKKWAKHASETRRAGRLRAMVNLAASDPRLARRARDFVADPWLLNTPSGTLDLRTMELRPHDPADGLTMLTGAAYRPDAQAAAWLASLERILPGPELRRFLRRLVGVSAIGYAREHLLAILWGAGANGKTTVANALGFALGDYAHAGTVELLLGRHRPGAATPDVADLRGRRLVTVAETREDGRLAAERVKALTGGDPITARHLYGQPFTFQPSHTTWLLTNHRPRVDDDGDAIWRRLLLVPFTVTIPEHERDPELGHRLELEADGILGWIAQGAAEYLAAGLNPPAVVRAATAEYRQAEDAFAAWRDECTELVPEAFTPTARLRESYAEWARRNGSEELTSNAISERLSRRAGETLNQHRGATGARGWKGIRLVDEGVRG
jgi:putative DNA primase/helicase